MHENEYRTAVTNLVLKNEASTGGCMRGSDERDGHGITNTNFNIHPNNLISVVNDEKWRTSDIVEFTVKFNGEAVESNEMDADELATSLLGISAVLEESNTILNGQYSKMLVKVRSSFKPGSFIVDIATFFTSDGITAIVNIGSLIGFIGGVGTLIWFFRKTKGEKILTKKQVQGNNYEITVKNSDSLTIINGDVLMLYESASVREALRKVTYPLSNKGISDITFLKNGKECEKISIDEKEYFTLLDKESIDTKEDVDDFLITQSNFEGKQTGWRVSFGDTTSSDKKSNDFPVKILDEDFLQKVKEQKIIISNEGTIIKAKYKKVTQKLERLIVNWELLEILKIDHTSDKHTTKIKRFFSIL
jgi:hypothetical protein